MPSGICLSRTVCQKHSRGARCLITGRLMSKKALVSQDNYVHKPSGNVRDIQIEALAQRQPPLTLSGYARAGNSKNDSAEMRRYIHEL